MTRTSSTPACPTTQTLGMGSILTLLHPEETEPVILAHAAQTIKSLGYVASKLQEALDEYVPDDPQFKTALTLIDTAWNLLDEAMSTTAGRWLDSLAWDFADATLVRVVVEVIKGHDVSPDDLRRARERLLED
jgi:hypothetical protein